MRTFAEVIRARSGDGHVGLRFGDTAWTWDEIVGECAARAAVLRARHPAGRPHIGVLLENVPDYVFWIGAAALGGATVIGINPTRRGEELARDIRHTDCDLIVTEDRLAGLLDGIDHGVPGDRVLNVDGAPYAELLAGHRGAPPPATPRDPGAPLLLLFSSGSTGAPKAVICSQGRYAGLAEAMATRTELTRESVTYLCMPLFHGNSAMMNLAPAAQVGATIVMARKFSASGFVRDLHRHRVTFVNYVGRALSYVLAQPETERDADCALDLAVGTEASSSDIARFTARFGCRVEEGYGMSEGVLRINRTPETPPGSLGLPVGGADLRILDAETGRECPPAAFDADGRLRNAHEATGQIVAVGMADRFEGYYNNPEARAERVRGDDFWTGDLAYRDAAGFFYFAGRTSDWLRVDGENFSAAPVERVLERFEPVTVAAVYAVPDPRTGDQVMCTLQLRPGARFDAGAFGEFLDGQADLGTKWRPRFVRIAGEVPVTGSGKIAKTALRESAWQTDDPVFHRVGAETGYRPLDEAARAGLEREFAAHDRLALLPASYAQATACMTPFTSDTHS